MQKQSLLNVYDHKYAEGYNDKFLLNPFSKISADFEYNTLSNLIAKETSWLDIGCGTGYFLSRFPGIQRAGIDISPGMLSEAKKVNPDALFFQEGDFRNNFPEWKEKWSLVTCMWYPYSYVESITEVEKVILNMIDWTEADGTIFLPVADLEDLRPFAPPLDYEFHDNSYNGIIYISGFTWTWIEHDGEIVRPNMVAPHFEHVIRLMAPYFETLEVVRYPPYYEGWVSRKAIVARNKLANNKDSEHKATIIRHPIPAPANSSSTSPVSEDKPIEEQVVQIPQLSEFSHRQLIREVARRVKNGYMLRSLVHRIFK